MNSPKAVPRLHHLPHANLGTQRREVGRQRRRQQDEKQNDQKTVPEAETKVGADHAKGDSVFVSFSYQPTASLAPPQSPLFTTSAQ